MDFRLFPTATLGIAWLAIVLICAPGAFAQPANAQPTSTPPAEGAPTRAATDVPPQASPTEPAATTPAGEGGELDTYLLRDDSGKLVPVVGMSYNDFKQLLDLKLKLAPPAPPAFTLDSLTATGTAADSVASLQVRITLHTRGEGWIRVPLRMSQAVLREPVKYQGGGSQFTTCEPAGEGYICWIQGGEDKPHHLTLSLAAPIVDAGTERRLALSLARGTESLLKLTVPLARVEAGLRNGGEGIVSVVSLPKQQSEIKILGASGDLQLGWSATREQLAPGPALLESSGEIAVKVESKNRISSEARLRVRNLSGLLSSFQVRLPPGMEAIPGGPAGYTVSPVSPAEGAASDKAGGAKTTSAKATSDKTGGGEARPVARSQIVEVKLDRPTSGVAEVRLLATLATDAQSPASAIEPARFQVLGAVRQRGTIDFTVDGDWSLQWTEDASVRRVDLPAEAAAGKTVARFEYFRQPCNLKLHVSSRPTRIIVEPTYLVQVDARQMRLEATLKFRLRGARTAAVTIAPGDWKFDRVSPDGLVDFAAGKLVDGQPLVLPLAEEASRLSEWELKLEAHREIPEGSTSLLFSLPRPAADVVTPATVIVSAADNVELTPHAVELRGLTPDSAPLAIRLPARQQQPLVYRDLGAGEPAVFSSGFQVRSRRTTVQAEAQVTFDARWINVEQHLLYRISYEAQRAFEILVPGELPKGADVRVLLGTQSLPLAPVVMPAGQFNSVGRRLRFETPGDQIGPCEFVVKYSLPMPRLNRSTPAAVIVPLVIPADEANQELSGQTIVASFADDLRVENAAEAVDAASSLPRSAVTVERDGSERVRLTLPTMTSKSEWKVTSVEPGQSGATQVLKAWVQSSLTANSRAERAAWRLTTSQDTLRVRLPTATTSEDVQVAIDGVRNDDVVREGTELRIALPPAVAGREITLETWYAVASQRQRWGWLQNRLEPPTIVGAAAPRKTYWQVCVPESENLLLDPTDFSTELQWQWKRFYWARRAALNQTQLEQWAGASRQDPVAASANQYLFSSFGRNGTLQFESVGRRSLLLVASCGVLGLGLLLIHVRQLRRPSLLLAGAVLLSAAALLAPETTILVAEAALLGFLLALAAAIWMWLSSGQSPWPAPAPTSVHPVVPEPKSTEATLLRAERASPATTATAPVALATAEPRL